VTRDTHGEEPDISVPADYLADHPKEHPEQWGWHGEFGKWADAAGWVVVAILLVMNTATHYNYSGNAFLWVTAALLVVGLLYNRHRRKNAWRR
jgi:uncharacterized protein DUF2631